MHGAAGRVPGPSASGGALDARLRRHGAVVRTRRWTSLTRAKPSSPGSARTPASTCNSRRFSLACCAPVETKSDAIAATCTTFRIRSMRRPLARWSSQPRVGRSHRAQHPRCLDMRPSTNERYPRSSRSAKKWASRVLSMCVIQVGRMRRSTSFDASPKKRGSGSPSMPGSMKTFRFPSFVRSSALSARRNPIHSSSTIARGR